MPVKAGGTDIVRIIANAKMIEVVPSAPPSITPITIYAYRSTTVTFVVTGGIAPYTATTASGSGLTPTVSGTTISVNVSAYTTFGAYALTVVDAKGAQVTASITVGN